MSWQNACKSLRNYIVKIETPDGYGTGFFFAYNENRAMVAIATALHVVSEAYEWRKPIRIRHGADDICLPHEDRVILIDRKRDSAAILMLASALKAPETMLGLVAVNKYMRPGTRVMWGGYPGIAEEKLCFFDGVVSAFNRGHASYYLDGVAINGVSGGPVFDDHLEGQPSDIVGIVSAYFVNRQRGETLPGFAMAHDVTHLHATIAQIKNLDDAKDKEEQQRQASTSAQAGKDAKPGSGSDTNPSPEPKPKQG